MSCSLPVLVSLAVTLVLCPDLTSSEYTSRVRVPPLHRNHDWPCPREQDIHPCICTADSFYNLRMDCSKAKNLDELRSAFHQQYPFPDFLELKIEHDPTDSNLDLTAIEPQSFDDKYFERFIIRGSRLQSFSEDALTLSHESLKLLDLSSNQLQEFPFETISQFTNLETFKIDYNYFTRLPRIESGSLTTLSVSGNSGMTFDNDVFYGARTLETIFMAELDITLLMHDLFDNQFSLSLISLEGNNIQSLDEATFLPVNSTLNHLILSQNQISFIRHDAIHGLDSNAIVSLVGNQLQELPQETWEDIFLQILPHGIVDLTNNPLNCNCDMKWIFLEPDNKYLPLITEGTTCYDGTQLTTLDANWFTIHCP